MKNKCGITQKQIGATDEAPSLTINKLGIVSRNYTFKFPNGYRDFSHVMPDVLKSLDKNKCDAVLFSLYSIVPRKSFDLHASLRRLRNIKMVLFEKFIDGQNCPPRGREYRCPLQYVIYHRTLKRWQKYELKQWYGTLKEIGPRCMACFVENELPRRVLGNCCVLICGETNGVHYSDRDRRVHDDFCLREKIPRNVKIILNPIHDRMGYDHKTIPKRKFLSENERWTVSVWNKGKKYKNGKVKKENQPAWTVYHDGEEIAVAPMKKQFGVEVGIINI